MMASSTTSQPQKKLAEFLKDQQEPFVLEVYLLERGYSNSSKILERSASTKKRKSLLPFSKLLTSVCKKLASHSETTPSTTTTDSHNREDDNEEEEEEDIVSVPETQRVGQIVGETDRFSSASSSTAFNSCSEIDYIEEETSISSSSHRHPQPSFISETCQASNVQNILVRSQQATNIEKHLRRFIDDNPALLTKIPSARVSLSQNDEEGVVNEDSGRRKQRMPQKMTEDSLLSAALWGLLIESAKRDGYGMELREILGPNVSQTLKSKRALEKTKQLLFDCVREIAVSSPRNDDVHYNKYPSYKQLLGPQELGKLICDRTREWGQLAAGDPTNLTHCFTSDYSNSINQWMNGFHPHMKDISFEIADAILEHINNEIVSEMIQFHN